MVSTCPDLWFQLAKAGAQRYEVVHKNERGWIRLAVVRLQGEEEEDQAELEQDEESENLEDVDVDVDDVLADMKVEGDYGTEVFTIRNVMIILLFSTAAQTSALSPTVA